jgi:hypothetical protein
MKGINNESSRRRSETVGNSIFGTLAPYILLSISIASVVFGAWSYKTSCTALALAVPKRLNVPTTFSPLSGPIEWLHIPKTGTSFGNVLINWACSDLLPPKRYFDAKKVLEVTPACKARFRNREAVRWFTGSHLSLENRTEAELRSVFTLIR